MSASSRAPAPPTSGLQAHSFRAGEKLQCSNSPGRERQGPASDRRGRCADVSELDWLASADRNSPWSQAVVVVAGIGVSGFAAADGLLEFGANVSCWTTPTPRPTARRRRCWRPSARPYGWGRVDRPAAAGAHLVITTGFSPAHPLLVQAARREVPIWSEVELAWRLQPTRPASCPGSASPARTARPPPPRCWSPSCARPDCGPRPSATSAGRSWRPSSTPSRTTCSPSSCPATSCTGRTRWPCTPRWC